LRRAARRRQIDQICLPDLVSVATPEVTQIESSLLSALSSGSLDFLR
jgi:hypothetical protein